MERLDTVEHMAGDRQMRAAEAEELAHEAVRWMLNNSSEDSDDYSLYHGRAGVLLALQEARGQVPEPELDVALEQGLARLTEDVDRVEDASLYFGLTGVAFTLHALGQPGAARTALRRVRERAVSGRWGGMFELFAGNAGIGLGALCAGEVDLAVDAVAPYVSTWTATAHGVNWPVRPTPPRSHHIAHGTLGIVYALASIGRATGRSDLVDLAVAGANDVVGRNEAGPDGFLVPHSDPPHRPELIERYSLGWCNGPAGDAQVFRLLRQVTDQRKWTAFGDRCWHTVTTSGLPERIRPGFWDNSGRCCGTAGVLALACDRIIEQGDTFDFADALVDDLAARATRDQDGARWSNHEHRKAAPDLDPRPGWAMGNAGIVRELLRYARLSAGQSGAYVIPWPDQPPTLT